MKFSEEEKLLLLQVAQSSIKECIENKQPFSPNRSLDFSPLNMETGAFVSVYHQNDLRGCLGRFKSDKPLYLLIARLAASAASTDNRFEPISKIELEKTFVEISILSPMKQVHHADEIKIGKHGVYMKSGSKSGTLLPQVAVKQKWNAIQLLEFCAKNKVGIDRNEWMNAELFVYEALVFNNR